MWIALIIVGFCCFLRVQIEKYFNIYIDWHLLFHIITGIMGFLVLVRIILGKSIIFFKREFFFIVVVLIFLGVGIFYDNLLITYWGIFEYLYLFLLPYFISFLGPKGRDVKLIFNSFKILIILMVGIAVYQLIEYMLYNTLHLIPSMIFKNHPESSVRFGILRPPSLVGTPTEWGSLTIIYLFMKLYREKFRLSYKVVFFILILLLSMTRAVYMCMVGNFFLFLLIMRKKTLQKDIVRVFESIKKLKERIRLLRILMVVIITISVVICGKIILNLQQGKIDFLEGEGHLRGYAFYIASNISNKVLGLGPGKFGSYVCFTTNSPYLSIFDNYILSNVHRIKTIDSFWLQTFIEGGILGIVLNIFLFIFFYNLIYYTYISINPSKTILKAITFSSLFIPLTYVIIGTGNTTFFPTYVWWASLLSGISLGYFRKEKIKIINREKLCIS